MSGTSFGEGYGRDADSTPDLLAYLDAVARIPAMARAKHEATVALELDPGAAVLDVGCGTGVDLAELAEQVGPGGRVVGLDPDAAALAAARVRHAGATPVELVEGVVEHLPFADGTFDACRADRTLQHADPELALVELRRVTREGGRLVVLEVSVGIAGADLDAGVLERLSDRHFSQGDQAWVPLMLPLLLGRAGWTHVDVEQSVRTSDRRADVDTVLRLPAALHEAVAGGHLDAAAADRLQDALERAERRGALVLQVKVVRFAAVAGQPGSLPSRGRP